MGSPFATPRRARGNFPEYLSSRHEETAIAMASGYAKSTGPKLPARCCCTPTVGALHATMGMRRRAAHERIPMVAPRAASQFHSVSGPEYAHRAAVRCACSPTVGGPARLVAPA